MKTWNDITHFAGFDWAKDHHDVLVLDGAGKIVAEFADSPRTRREHGLAVSTDSPQLWQSVVYPCP